MLRKIPAPYPLPVYYPSDKPSRKYRIEYKCPLNPYRRICSGNWKRRSTGIGRASLEGDAILMLGDVSRAERIYIACGYTDMRKSIDGLSELVQQRFKLDPFSNSLFLFCGRRCDRLKALYWEGDGLLRKRVELHMN